MTRDEARRSRTRLWIWLLLLLTAPVPFYGLSSGVAPPVRLFFVASLVSGFLLSAPDLLAGLQFLIYGGQALLWSSILYIAAGFIARRLEQENTASRRWLVALVAACVVLALLPVYHVPLSSGDVDTNWFGLFR